MLHCYEKSSLPKRVRKFMPKSFMRLTPEDWKIFAQLLQKVAQYVAEPKIAKISSSELSLKVRNIYIKPLLKHLKTLNKQCFETANLSENIKNNN